MQYKFYDKIISFSLGKKYLLLLSVILLFNSNVCTGQAATDTVKPAVKVVQDTTGLAKNIKNRQVRYHYLADFYSSVSLTQLINNSNNYKGNLYFYYNATLAGDLYYKQLSYNVLYLTDFGINKYFDSIAIIQTDQYSVKNSISYRLGNSKFAANLMQMSRSQYYNHYTYSVDSVGNTIAKPYSSYKSPGYNIISAGIKLSEKRFSIEFGLVNGMRTVMKNQKYYDILQTANLYGVEKGKGKKLDFGFTLTLSAPTQKINKCIYFENFSQFRVVKDDLPYLDKYCFDINQAFHFIFLKFFRLSLRTKVTYDYHKSPKPAIVNNITLGFYFHNSL